MEDNWKKIFEDNKEKIREEFTLPSGHEKRFLDKLEQEFPLVEKPKFNYWKVAAVLIPLMMLSIYYWTEMRPENTDNQSFTLAEISPELGEAENQLAYLVEVNVKKVKSMETEENRELVDNSLNQLQNLQRDYNHLLDDLKESGGNPQVMKSVLMNLQLQVEVLETVLNQINTIQEFKHNQNETIL